MKRLAALTLLAALAAAGCGPQGDLVESRPLVRDQAAAPALGSTSARTALDWWERLRARDAEAILAGLTPAARRTVDLAHLRNALGGRFGKFLVRTKANVLYTERSPRMATVYLRIDIGTLVGSAQVTDGTMMLALRLVPRDGAWLLENASWLRGEVESSVASGTVTRKLRREYRRRQAEGQDK